MIAASWFDGIDGLLADWDARTISATSCDASPRLSAYSRTSTTVPWIRLRAIPHFARAEAQQGNAD